VAIASNRCRTALDRRARLPIVAVIPDHAVPAAASGGEIGEELQIALAQLRCDYRRCFELFYRDELSINDVAERLGVPQGTVKTWLHRARKELAEHLEQRGVLPGADP
jgi:RNA polymerase sigma-70 factor (ECF subfamily)